MKSKILDALETIIAFMIIIMFELAIVILFLAF